MKRNFIENQAAAFKINQEDCQLPDQMPQMEAMKFVVKVNRETQQMNKEAQGHSVRDVDNALHFLKEIDFFKK
ncbi:MAG: hypothetical protein K2X66_09665, partial [Cyanobacteria bacterium]|nr:hypothetical protein [Cyanobacteriota bacterium]